MAGLMLHNARLIDGTGRAPMPDAAVLIEDGKFTWVGKTADAPDADGAERIDLGGRTICPGFFDCHVHFSLPGPSASPWERLQVPLSYHTLSVFGTPVKVGNLLSFLGWPCRHPCLAAVGAVRCQGGAPAAQRGRTTVVPARIPPHTPGRVDKAKSVAIQAMWSLHVY